MGKFVSRRLTALAVTLALLITGLSPALAAQEEGVQTQGASDWAVEELARAASVGLVPEELMGNWQQPITRAEFAQLAVRYLAVEYGYEDDGAFVNDYLTYNRDRNGEFWGDEEFGDGLTWWERFSAAGSGHYLTDLPEGEPGTYIKAAYSIGIVNGKGDGSIYDPEGSITRQEAACMLMRSYRVLDREDYRVPLYSKFQDYDQMGTWAIDDMGAAVGLGVMNGVSDSLFDPTGTYTREQAVTTFLRLHESAPVSAVKGNITPMQEAAYARMLDEVLSRGQNQSAAVEFRADTDSCTVVAVSVFGGMHFYPELWLVRRDGTSDILWSGATADWSMSEDERTFTFTAEGDTYQVELPGGTVTKVA
jgi:hypothetical protein